MSRSENNEFINFVQPVIDEASKLSPAMPLLIAPGNDWPEALSKEQRVFLPNALIDQIRQSMPKEDWAALCKEGGAIMAAEGLDANGKPLESNHGAEPSDDERAKAPFKDPVKPGRLRRAVQHGLVGASMLFGGGTGEMSAASAQEAAMVASEESKRRPRRDDREAYTLTEVLVAMAIVGTLVGLTLPAVQKVRDTAADISFKNNMKQVALAVKGYETDNGSYPYAVKYDQVPGGALVPHSWVVDVLPYLEQNNLAGQYNRSQLPDAQTMSAFVPVLNHPAYPLEENRLRIGAISTSGYTATDPAYINTNATRIIGQSYIRPSDSTPGDFDVIMPPQWVIGPNGQFIQNAATRDVAKGTSNTVMLGPNLHRDPQQDNRDPYFSDGKVHKTGDMFGVELGNSHFGAGPLGNEAVAHLAVLNHVSTNSGVDGRRTRAKPYAFGDGSVRSVADTGNPQNGATPEALLLQQLSIKSGNTVSDDLDR